MAEMKSGRINKRRVLSLLLSLLRFLLVFGLAFIILKPFIYKILMAFMSPDDLLDSTVQLIPRHPSTYYWKTALEGMQIATAGLNTLLLSVSIGLIQVVACTMIGYGLGRYRFKGSRLAFVMVVVIMMVPQQVISIAQYLGFVYFGVGSMTVSLVDSFTPLYILSFTGLGIKEGLYIYLMREFFRSMPKDLEEAAYIDGAGSFRTFIRIMLPNARTMMVTVFLFSFCWQWTDTLYSSLYFSELPVFSNTISTIYVRVGLALDPMGSAIAQNAAAMLMIIPLLLLFALCQKALVKSIAVSGMAN